MTVDIDVGQDLMVVIGGSPFIELSPGQISSRTLGSQDKRGCTGMATERQ